MYEYNNCSREFAKKFEVETSCIYYLAVLSDDMAGKVWCDSITEPSMLLVWSEYQEGFQFMGKPLMANQYNDFKEFMSKTIKPFLESREIEEFEYATDTEELFEMICNIYSNKEISFSLQYEYELQCRKVVEINNIQFFIERIDRDFFNNNYENSEYVKNEINISWGCYEKYLNKAYGYAAIYDNKIIGRAIIIGTYDDKDNITVDTLIDFRRRGVAISLVENVLRETEIRGRNAIWDCTEDNIASQKTAEKLGFQLCRKYKVGYFKI